MSRFAPFFIIVAASLWGFDGVLLRPYLYSLPVPLVVFTESSIVLIILLPMFIKKRKELLQFNRSDWVYFFFVALLGGAIGTMAITKALFYVNYVNLSIVVLIQKLQPLFALILAFFLLKEKPKKSFFLWAGFAIVGAYIMTFGFTIPSFNLGDKTTLASIFSLIAAISFGSSTVLSKRALQNVSFEIGTYLRFLFASIILLLLIITSGSFESFLEITSKQWLIFMIIAFTTGGAAIFLYYYGLKKITASVATICELAFPLTAVILEYILRDNILSVVQWIGVIILFIAILKVTRYSKE
nr:DMT family transporter [uncultured Sphaerochaeta sp.]